MGDFLCQLIERPMPRDGLLGKSPPRQQPDDRRRRRTPSTCRSRWTPIGKTRQPLTFTRDPVAEVLANRGRYIAAILTIARAYRVAGSPGKPPPRLPQLRRWSDNVRSPLVWLGWSDPDESIKAVRAADPVGARVFLVAAPMAFPRLHVGRRGSGRRPRAPSCRPHWVFVRRLRASATGHVEFLRLNDFKGKQSYASCDLILAVTTAATLNAHGITDIQTSSQAAEALRPIAGRLRLHQSSRWASLARDYLHCRCLPAAPHTRWERRYTGGSDCPNVPVAHKLWHDRRCDIRRCDPQLHGTRSDQGVVLERCDQWGDGGPIMILIMLLASRQRVMGQFTLGPWLKTIGWLATAVMAAAAIAMFATWGSSITGNTSVRCAWGPLVAGKEADTGGLVLKVRRCLPPSTKARV